MPHTSRRCWLLGQRAKQMTVLKGTWTPCSRSWTVLLLRACRGPSGWL